MRKCFLYMKKETNSILTKSGLKHLVAVTPSFEVEHISSNNFQTFLLVIAYLFAIFLDALDRWMAVVCRQQLLQFYRLTTSTKLAFILI